MKTRELRDEDIPYFVETVFRYKRTRDPSFPEDSRERIAAAFHGALHGGVSRSWVCLDETGAPCGYIMCHLVDYPMIAGKEIYVSDLLIDESRRGGGAGGALLARVETYASERRCERIMLNNPKDSEGYRREFYKKHGFTERIGFANFVKEVAKTAGIAAGGGAP